ncbi:hypoxanthine phosphoribosyltransferase [Haliangium ochraceum]|uniref:Hypoxanthine phosphoribosyltransferase n=1 Tax=Haliangium ochraceum (strain DSM 14365 / JCM 11303 / SMP-2) TaxID=502025 RepID=D0LV96_HALO1|nr:hypoxanthine phosphoribosyltransferase [Haliangium ochraceum]ACY15937.1 hypoxanthine phosphoribosyltransferase [Haliangium ochraceum DSM 14365]
MLSAEDKHRIFASEGPIEQLLSAEQIAARVAELGRQITEDYREHAEDLMLLSVLKGSILFVADLCRAISLPLTMEFIGIASYGDETRSSGVVQITADLTRPIEGKHVLIVEDIIDTGLTAHYLRNNLRTRNPASVKLCSLLHKPERAEREVEIDYLGFTVPDKFVLGYGLDVAQQFRNLPYIGYLTNA